MKKTSFMTACLGAAWLFGMGAAHAQGAGAQGLMAGAGRADIQIPATLFPIDKFDAQHDPLAVRVMLLVNGNSRAAIVVVDQTSMSDEAVARIKAILKRVDNVDAGNVLLAVSHGFSAPHVFSGAHMPPDAPAGTAEKAAVMAQAIDTAAEAAAGQALAGLQAAHLGFGQGTSRVAVNRDVPTSYGWWLGGDDAGFSDTGLGVVRLDRADGKPLAVLMNYGVQSSVLDYAIDGKGQRVISSDLAGEATRGLEAHYGDGAVAIWLVGAAGDQAPYLQADHHVVNADGSATRVQIGDAQYALLDLEGGRLTDDALKAAEAAEPSQGAPTIQVAHIAVHATTQGGQPQGRPPSGPVKSFEPQTGPAADIPVTLLRIGDVAIVGVRPELSSVTGAWIKDHSPFKATLVVTMVDGGDKYMPDASSYDHVTYEARSAHYVKGTAETVAAAAVEALKAMHDGKALPQ